MSDIKRYDVGEAIDSFPVFSWNSIDDAIVEIRSELDTIAENANKKRQSLQSSLQVRIINKSGTDAVAHGILGIDDFSLEPPAISGGDNKADGIILSGVTLRCVEATEADHADNFVITLQPILDEAIGWAMIPNAMWCRVDMTDATHKYAKVKDGEAEKLESAAFGPVKIIQVASGTGDKWAVVRFIGPISSIITTATVDELAGVTGGTFAVANVAPKGNDIPTSFAEVLNPQGLHLANNDTVFIAIHNDGTVSVLFYVDFGLPGTRHGNDLGIAFVWQDGNINFFVDVSLIDGYVEGVQQFLTHEASGGCRWESSGECDAE